MSTENAPVQDENAIITRSKPSIIERPVLQANPSGKSALQVRPALSNLTNTTSTHAVLEGPASKQVTTSSKIPLVEEAQKIKKLPLKRSATEDIASDVIVAPEPKRQKKDYIWDDLDAEDADDPLMVSEYVVEIFEYLSRLEEQTLPDPTYLTWQTNLKPKMRTILVDWIVEVHLRFRLLPETLFLAINIMDRFMSKEMVQVDKLQLLATGSLFIAGKYEEVYSPSVKNYSYVTDGGYTEEQILSAERYILQTLGFSLCYPNPMNFLRRISKADDYDIETRTIGKYLLEVSIMDHRFIGKKPSLCAATAMFVARKMLKRGEWNGSLIHYSGGYKKDDMKETVELLLKYLVEPVVHEEFFKKYASKKYMKASILARQWAKKVQAEEMDLMSDDS